MKYKSKFFVIAILFTLGFISTSFQEAFAEHVDVKRSDTPVFQIGYPFTLMVEDPDLNLDGDRAESHSLNLITFESDKIKKWFTPFYWR